MTTSSVLAESTSSTEAGPNSPIRNAWLWVLLTTVLAGILRTLYLTSQGIIPDEAFTIFLCRSTFANFVHLVWGWEFNMLLYNILLRQWMHFGLSEFFIRIPSMLFATATVPVIFLLGRRLFGDRAGLLAALLFAVHPYQLMLSQRARSYPLLILLISLASLCLVRGLQSPTWRIWTTYAVISVAAATATFSLRW